MEHSTLTFDTISKHPQEFYKQIYFVQNFSRQELIDLHEFSADRPVIVVDSCGWHYQQIFPQHNIHRVEGVTTCKNMKISREQVDTLFDDRGEFPIFPNIGFDNAVVILDHSLLLKYRTPNEIKTILDTLTTKIPCVDICVRLGLLYSNDDRFQNRLEQLIKIVPNGYSVVKFNLNFNATYQPLMAHFLRDTVYESSSY